MKNASLSTKLAAALGIAVFAVQGCRSHPSATSCGDPYLTGVAYVGYGGIGWGGGYYVDPYYAGYGYPPGGAGWFYPGDDYDPDAVEPPGGWDNGDGIYFPGADDPSSDVGDPSGGVPSDTDTGGDDTSGSGADTAGTTSLRTRSVSIASGTNITNPELPDANGCYSCLVGCRVGSGATETGQQALAGSSYDYASACRSAVHRLERWAHTDERAPIADCQVLVPAPIADADGGPDAATRTSAEASVGDDDASASPDADVDAARDAGDGG